MFTEVIFFVRLETSKAQGIRDNHYETRSSQLFPARLKIRPLLDVNLSSCDQMIKIFNETIW